jgi:hypothetical protein
MAFVACIQVREDLTTDSSARVGVWWFDFNDFQIWWRLLLSGYRLFSVQFRMEIMGTPYTKTQFWE